MDDTAVVTSISQTENKKKRKNIKFTDGERYLIGEYTATHGRSATVKKFKKSHPHLTFRESTARSLRVKYHELLKKKKADHSSSIPSLKRGRPLMLGTLDEKVKNFIYVLRRKGAVVNTVVAVATAKALIARSSDEHLKCLDLESSYWAKSLFRRMGFVKRACTTSKPEIPEQALKEAKLLFQHQIVDLIDRHSIPFSLIMNFDQTPLKYAPAANQTLSKKGSKHVAIKGSSFKQAITATFGITFSTKFLPMQFIDGGKTGKSLPRVQFRDTFSLSVNEKHYSNTHESIKLIDEIIVPYIEKEREMLQLPADQPALLMIDVFSGQMTEPVMEKMRENNIKLVRVPPNMTYFFQALDLTVNVAAKAYLKSKFTEWYSNSIAKQLDEGEIIEDVKLKLSILKPLHAEWIKDLYNHLTSEKNRTIISNGWKAAFITEDIENGSSSLEPLDPFYEVDPLINTEEDVPKAVRLNDENAEYFITPSTEIENENGGWEFEGEPINNIFDILDDL